MKAFLVFSVLLVFLIACRPVDISVCGDGVCTEDEAVLVSQCPPCPSGAECIECSIDSFEIRCLEDCQ